MDFAYILQPVKTEPYFQIEINLEIMCNISLTKNNQHKKYGNEIGTGRPTVIHGVTTN